MSQRDKQKTGVLLLNLGGPDSLNSVKPFLYNLFSDRDIIRLGPSFMQRPLAWLISTLRSSKARKMYTLIGGKSPILDITKSQAEALESILNKSLTSSKVYIGMRYWHPFIEDTVQEISRDGINNLVVLSLYPHYSKTTTGSSIAEFKRSIERLTVHDTQLTVKYIEEWYDFPPYIDALAELIVEGLQEFKGEDFHLLYSAHSLPESFIREGDPYLDHIKMTIRLLNEKLASDIYNFNGLKWSLSFQSKTGPVKWLEPSTDDAIINLSNAGCRNIFIVPISFVSDHIETLYEIDILFKRIAEEHGLNLRRCRALNTSERFIGALKELVMRRMGDR